MGAPYFAHQAIVTELSAQLRNYLIKKNCRVFVSPFDVRFTRKSTDEKEIYTVLQPDIIVVCDKNKNDMKDCIGALDNVVEVLSPGNN